METTSVWRATAAALHLPELRGDLSADVLVIGGGITGVTLALLLARQGTKVVLLEANQIGSGTTGNSTGNLYETLSQGMREVRSRWGDDVLRLAVSERRSAVDFIEAQAAGADVGFRRCPLVLYAQDASYQSQVEDEADALARASSNITRAEVMAGRLPPAAGPALNLHNQAQIQPASYVLHLAAQAIAAGASIFERSPAVQVDFDARSAVTEHGTIRARELVVATHTPKGIRLVHAEMPVHREYAVALSMPFADLGPGIFWAKGESSLSVRTMQAASEGYLICAGSEHKTGLHDANAGLRSLQEQVRQHYGNASVAYQWSAQNYQSADYLPYIGRDATGCFVATGFATDGLTWGTVAARLIAQELAGERPQFAELCKPTRLSPVKGGKKIVEEVKTMAGALVKDYLTDRQEQRLVGLQPGESAIVDQDGDSIAAWRSEGGELFAVSPVCTHMGCKVHWNGVERSWDCPCHGSRFRPDGTVIEGPALRPLKRKEVKG